MFQSLLCYFCCCFSVLLASFEPKSKDPWRSHRFKVTCPGTALNWNMKSHDPGHWMRHMRKSYCSHSTCKEIEVHDLAKVSLGEGPTETWVMPQIPENPHSSGPNSVLNLSFTKLAIHAVKAYSRASLPAFNVQFLPLTRSPFFKF